MRNLHPLLHNNYAAHESIAESRSGSAVTVRRKLRALKASFDVYQSVCQGNAELSRSKFTEKSVKDAFLRLYDSPPKCVSDLKKKILEIEQEVCPYCCGSMPPTTIDHFLEKSKYPEYSLFSCNLVPSCVKCNSNKNIDSNKIWKIHHCCPVKSPLISKKPNNDNGLRSIFCAVDLKFFGRPGGVSASP